MSPRNHADCDAVLTGEIIAGRYVQLAVERHLDDLKHAHERGLHFDADIAGKSLRFVEAVCTHQKAEWAGKPFLLSPNQQFILWNLIGWRRADGCRRFRRAYITAGSLPQPAGTVRTDAEVQTRAGCEGGVGGTASGATLKLFAVKGPGQSLTVFPSEPESSASRNPGHVSSLSRES